MTVEQFLRFRVEYHSGWFKFHSLEWDRFFRGTPTLADVWLALRLFAKLNEEGGL